MISIAPKASTFQPPRLDHLKHPEGFMVRQPKKRRKGRDGGRDLQWKYWFFILRRFPTLECNKILLNDSCVHRHIFMRDNYFAIKFVRRHKRKKITKKFNGKRLNQNARIYLFLGAERQLLCQAREIRSLLGIKINFHLVAAASPLSALNPPRHPIATDVRCEGVID